jgi:asparagine synthase (glutamine-hydrolysing)
MESNIQDALYFYVKQVGEQIITEGVSSQAFGHKILHPNGQNLDGIFVEWSWDKNRLLVQNDRYGFYPLYYFSKPGELALSTSIPKLITLGAPVTLDEAALAVFFRLGFFIGEDTPFKAIKVLPPCATFEWQNGQLHVSGNLPSIKEDRMSYNSAIDAYISLFRKSIQRRIPHDDNFVIPLSGGRDSRHILLELCAAGYRPKFCVTTQKDFLNSSSEEIKIAKQLTTALKLEHVVFNQIKSRLKAELRKNIITNFCTDEHAWYLVVADYLRKRTNVVYDGIGGDVLSESMFLTKESLDFFDSGKVRDLAQFLLYRCAGEQTWMQLLGKEYHRFNLELAISHLSDELKLHMQAPNPVRSFYFANRTRREVALMPYCILSDVGTVFSPYLDHELYNFLASLPASLLLDRNFHTETIQQAYPLYSNIPYARDSGDPWLHNWQFALELMRYVYLNHSSQLVRNSYLFPRLLRNLVDKSYKARFGSLIVYLIQLERFWHTNRI